MKTINNPIPIDQQLEYMAQMIDQLRTMAVSVGSDDLAHILDAAGSEARLQHELHRRMLKV